MRILNGLSPLEPSTGGVRWETQAPGFVDDTTTSPVGFFAPLYATGLSPRGTLIFPRPPVKGLGDLCGIRLVSMR